MVEQGHEVAQPPAMTYSADSDNSPLAGNERMTKAKKTTRADSGTAVAMSSLRTSSEDGEISRTDRISSRHRRPSATKYPTTSAYTSHRKYSTSSTARSSSGSAKHRKSREQRPRRLHSAPGGTLSRHSTEDALAFHVQSCQLMQAMYSHTTRDDSIAISTHHDGPASLPPDQSPTYDDRPVVETHDVQWTSEETRRRQYAEIDKRNRGIRKLLRKLLPSCMVTQPELDFYDEKDDSDAGSVRRYRLNFDDEKKHG